MTGPVRWGILGTASIARRRLVPALRASRTGVPVAVASREAGRAEAFAAEAGIARTHGTYQALVDDPGIDAVYIPLPNHLHLPWTLAALAAGKHVLCEKPVGLHAGEARAIADAARRAGRLVMEAFMYRYHPRWQAVHALVRGGGIGRLGSVHTHFSYHNVRPGDIRNRPELGGGALLDIGCYGISVARWLFGAEPVRTAGSRQIDPAFGIDRLATGSLTFGDGVGTFTSATQQIWHQHVTIVGESGRIEVARPFNPLPDVPTSYRLATADDEREVRFEPADQYAVMVERFEEAIRQGGEAPTPIADAIANLEVIDTLATGDTP